MVATATQVRSNFSKYIELSQKEDIMITKNEHVVAVLIRPDEVRQDRFKQLRGILKGNSKSLEEARSERLSTI